MTETITSRRRLGRGLEALLGPTREEAQREGSLVELAIAEIRPNPYQPRRDVDPAALDELTASIRKAGLLQPVVVRQAPVGSGGAGNGGFELIAGERRLRACQALGWEKIPAVKREVDDRTVLTLALVENLQRDDLSPVDEARGYERLIAEFNLTQQDVADAVGRDRSTVANALRLLKLSAAVLALLRRIKADSVPLDALGIQSHLHAISKEGFSRGVRELIDGAKALGLQVFITELDVNDDAVATADMTERDKIVAAIYRSYLTTALDGPEVKAVLTWGVSDKNTWLNNGTKFRKQHPERLQRPLPFEPDYAPAPAFYAMRDSFDEAKKR